MRDPWQPIETAPKDGREVILAVEYRAGIRHGVLVGHYMEGGHCIEDHPPVAEGWYFWNGCMFDKAAKPTHWLPLPHHPAWGNGWQALAQGDLYPEGAPGVPAGQPAHSKSEFKRRVALGDPNVAPPPGVPASDRSCSTCANHGDQKHTPGVIGSPCSNCSAPPRLSNWTPTQDLIDTRIKQLMQQAGFPNSMALYQAFKQFAQELTAHDVTGKENDLG